MKAVTRDELALIDRVPFTDTWSPWHHEDVMRTIDSKLKLHGLQPLGEQLEVSENGMNMFGHIRIAADADNLVKNKSFSIGFRNSMQKDFALGFVAGEYIYVCSNMGFFGEYREVHIHNASLTRGVLFDFVGRAVMQIFAQCQEHQQWLHRVNTLAISNDEVKVLTYDLMRSGVINPSRFNKFRMDFSIEKSAQDYGSEQTLGHLYGAVTRNLRGQSQNQLQQRTRKLDTFMKEIVA